MDRILVAEDNAALRLLYAIWLESGGFDVTGVEDARADALAAGAAEVLRKPCGPGQIVAAVRQHRGARLRMTA